MGVSSAKGCKESMSSGIRVQEGKYLILQQQYGSTTRTALLPVPRLQRGLFMALGSPLALQDVVKKMWVVF